MNFSFNLVLSVVYSFGIFKAIESSQVQLNNGVVIIGQQTNTAGSTPYYSYRGIPFAQPPVGHLRFKPPVPYNGGNGVTIHALQDGSQCIQMGANPANPIEGSEDCLYLNIYKPMVSHNAPLPVMVWVHGGGFFAGNSKSSFYGPDFFMDLKNVILVTVNYRLGIFGFLSTEDSAAYGNYGLLDQIEALKFVQQHISSFGGNPNSITLFGESAGGASVSHLLETPLTQGLIHRVIMQSGVTLSQFALSRNARNLAYIVGTVMGANLSSTQSLVNDLRRADYNILQRVANTVFGLAVSYHGIFYGLPYGPVREPVHPNAVITDRSFELLSTGRVKRVPVIVGIVTHEGLGFKDLITMFRPYFMLFDLDSSRLVPQDMNIQNQIIKAFVGQVIKNHYFGFLPVSLSDNQLMRYITDDQFLRPSRKFVELYSSLAPTYFYIFSFDSKLGNGGRATPGVAHADELPYLFYISFRDYTQLSHPEALTITRLTKLWTNFAITGNPTPSVDPTFNSQVWPVVNSHGSGNIAYFDIGNDCAVKTNPEKSTMDGWDYLYNQYGVRPYDTY